MNEQDQSEEEVVGDLPFASLLPDPSRLSADTLFELSGDKSLIDPGPLPSGLMRRVAKAWAAPLNKITCAQVRVLVGQQFGLQWLACPIALFVTEHPRVECDLYPGDLTVAALRAHAPLLQYAPNEAIRMLTLDFDWMEAEFAFDRDAILFREAAESLNQARRMARMV